MSEVLFVQPSIEANESFMQSKLGIGTSYDVDYRELIILQQKVQLYYINGLVDDTSIVQILKVLVEINDHECEESKLAAIIENRLMNQQVDQVKKMDVLLDELLNGLVVVFVDGIRHAYIVDVRHYPGRQPEEPDTERVIRGSRDGFTENIVENSALIRRRIKDVSLRNEIVRVGTRSKTDISITYLASVTNESWIEQVKDKINTIHVDGIVMADKALEEYFVNHHFSPFPFVRYTERPDVASQHLLQGYVVLIVDTSPSVIILPTTYFDLLEHAEEYRQTPAVGTFTRWIRVLAVLMSILLLPTWYLLASHPSLLPDKLSFIGPDEVGNVPLIIQVLIADFGVELMRMAAVHTPTPLATALGLIAAVLIGEIAVDVGLFVPEIILYVAISTIGTYVTPSYELSVANKFIKYFLMLTIIVLGKTGFIIGLTLTIIYLSRQKNFNVPYLWPLIPFQPIAFGRFLLRIPVPFIHTRPAIVHPKDTIKQSEK